MLQVEPIVDNTKVRRPNTLYQECKFSENEERVKDEDGYDVGAGKSSSLIVFQCEYNVVDFSSGFAQADQTVSYLCCIQEVWWIQRSLLRQVCLECPLRARSCCARRQLSKACGNQESITLLFVALFRIPRNAVIESGIASQLCFLFHFRLARI